MESLDNILAGGREAVPEQPTEEKQVAQVAEGEGQLQQIDDDEVQATEVDGQKLVPHAALHASKEKIKRYTAQVADFDRNLVEVKEQNAALTRQISELLQRVPQQQQARPEPTDFYVDPEKAFQERLQAALGEALGPVQQNQLAQSQMLASIKYGDDKVSEAEQAFLSAVQSQKLDPADYQKVVNSSNRYAAAVQWHQRQQAQAEIGDDPVAYKAKVKAELEAEREAEQGGLQEQRPAQKMPSNLAGARNVGVRNGPAWGGPSDLSTILAMRKRGA